MDNQHLSIRPWKLSVYFVNIRAEVRGNMDNRSMDTTIMETATRDRILALTRQGRTRAEATDWFRVAVGLHYLAGLMTKDAIDFKAVDGDYNRFIYHSIGGGHSITSVLQFMSGQGVLAVLESERFMALFAETCTDVPAESIPFLLELNLGVAKNISKLEVTGPVQDWLEKRKSI